VAGAWVGFNDSRVTLRSDYWGQGAHSALPIVGDFFQRALRSRLVDPRAKFVEEKQTGLFDSLRTTMSTWWGHLFGAENKAAPQKEKPRVPRRAPAVSTSAATDRRAARRVGAAVAVRAWRGERRARGAGRRIRERCGRGRLVAVRADVARSMGQSAHERGGGAVGCGQWRIAIARCGRIATRPGRVTAALTQTRILPRKTPHSAARAAASSPARCAAPSLRSSC